MFLGSKRKNLFPGFLLCCFSFLFLKAGTARATCLTDDFGTLEKWIVYENSGLVESSQGELFLDSSSLSFPYLYTKGRLFDENIEDFDLALLFSFPNNATWGTGFCLGTFAPPNNVSISVMISRNAEACMIKVWRDLSGSYFEFNECVAGNCGVSNPLLTQGSGAFSAGEKYKLLISRRKNFYSLKILRLADGFVVKSFVSDHEIATIPTFLWLGNPMFQGGSLHGWQQLKVYGVSCSENNNSPIVILPGLGASWNAEAMIKGKTAPQSEWQMLPFVNIYDNLVDSFIDTGYEKNKNLFVFTYDWRRPVDAITEDLKSYIDAKIDPTDKINLVGHSLGGIVSRNYWQKYGADKVNKIVTLGSPHQGAVRAYTALAGGVISPSPNWESVALNLMLRLRYPFFQTTAAIARQEAPVLFDLLPTFDFVHKGRTVISPQRLSFINQWLPNLNSSLTDLSSLNFIVGNSGVNTEEWLWLEPRDMMQQLLGLWPDGRPYKTVNGEGDLTVLTKSASLPGKTAIVFPLDHRELPNDSASVQEVMNILGVAGSPVATTTSYSPEDMLLFLVASPVDLAVSTPDGQQYFSNKDGFAFIPQPIDGKYEVKLIGTGDGEYQLVAGQLFGEQRWDSFTGTIRAGQEINYELEIDINNPQDPLEHNAKEKLLAAREEIRGLNSQFPSVNLVNALSHCDAALEKIENSDFETAASEVKLAIADLFSFLNEYWQLEPSQKLRSITYLLSGVRALLLVQLNQTSLTEADKALRDAMLKRSLAWQIIRLRQNREILDPLAPVIFNYGEELYQKARELQKKGEKENVLSFSSTALSYFSRVTY